MNKKTLYITQAALIAAIYVVLTVFINAFNLANGNIQIRISEALTILPAFTPAAIPGLFVGCIISNTVTGCHPLDITFGSLATLLGALGTHFISRYYWKNSSKKLFKKLLAPVPPIIANTIIVPFVLYFVYQIPGSIPFFMLTVGIGEVLSCGIIGFLLMGILEKYRFAIFANEPVSKAL